MFFNKKKPASPSPETDDTLFTLEDAELPEEESLPAATATATTPARTTTSATGNVSGGFHFPKLSPASVSSKVQTQQHGAFSSQPPVTAPAVNEEYHAVPVVPTLSEPVAVVESVQEAPFPVVKNAALPPQQAFTMNEPPVAETIQFAASPVEDDFDMTMDLPTAQQNEPLVADEALFEFELDAPYLPSPEELNLSPVVASTIVQPSPAESTEDWMDFSLEEPPAIASNETQIQVPTPIIAYEIGSTMLDPLEETTDQISLQTRHAVAGTEAFSQTQFSPIDSSIDLTGLAVEDSFDTLNDANQLNSDWVLQDIVVAEEQVALHAPQQPSLTGFTAVENNTNAMMMGVSQFEIATETSYSGSALTAELSEPDWPVQTEPDFMIVENTVHNTEATTTENMNALNDAFDFSVVEEDLPSPHESSFVAAEPPFSSAIELTTETAQLPVKETVEPEEVYNINEYDEVVVDFDSGELAMDADSTPHQLLSNVGISTEETPHQSTKTLVNGVNEYDEVVVDFDSGELAMDADSTPHQLLSNVTELIDPSLWVALNGESAESAVHLPGSSTEDEFNHYVAAGFESSSKTVYNKTPDENHLVTTSLMPEPSVSPATDGMISLAELVGSNTNSVSREQDNILGLSLTKPTLIVGQLLPFYDLELEKIKVLATAALPQSESTLLYLEIEPFYALFGFVDNQFQLLHTFQKNLLAGKMKDQFKLKLNACSATTGEVYNLTIGSWEALLTVKAQKIALHKILSHV